MLADVTGEVGLVEEADVDGHLGGRDAVEQEPPRRLHPPAHQAVPPAGPPGRWASTPERRAGRERALGSSSVGGAATGTGHPVRILWAVPRSASTAFERMVIERGDHQVFDEPWSAAYYHGPERVSPRYPESEPGATVASVARDVLAAAEIGPVFVKDMAYHPAGALPAEVRDRASHAFLVRDPRWAIPSMARIWPDLTEDEAGFAALARLHAEVSEAQRAPAPVIDSDDLCRDPDGVVGAWCAAEGLDPRLDALSWEAGTRPEWERWQDWYGATSRSTGFAPPRDGPPPELDDERLVALVQACSQVYEALRAHRLSAA